MQFSRPGLKSFNIIFNCYGKVRAQDLALAAGIAASHVVFNGKDIALGIHFVGGFEGLFRAHLHADLTALAVFGVDVKFIHILVRQLTSSPVKMS